MKGVGGGGHCEGLGRWCHPLTCLAFMQTLVDPVNQKENFKGFDKPLK